MVEKENFRLGFDVAPYNAGLRKLREKRAWSRRKMAEVLEVSPSYYGIVERMRAFPSERLMRGIEIRFEVLREDIFPDWLRSHKARKAWEIEREIKVESLETREVRMIEAGDCIEEVERRMDLERFVEWAFDGMSERRKAIMKFRFGFEDGEAHTLEDTGKRFGVTRACIGEIERRSLQKMRHPLKLEKLKGYL